MTVRDACLIGEQAVAQFRVICAEGSRKLAAMDIGHEVGSSSLCGSTYAHLSVEKRAVVDEVIAAANTMLESLKSSRFTGRPPHLILISFLDQLRAFEATARSQTGLAQVLETPARETVRSMLTSFGRDAACLDRVEVASDF
ncbi:hypothetical protein [Fulvimarina sp. MAC8]|uniref:hypothetical protein n=1 Tax=Fulvimarina sp. MAC8 TaxID=3162874 RepID=UPI0032EAD5DF